MAAENNLSTEIEKAVKERPIFYLSLHGAYQMGDYFNPADGEVAGKEPIYVPVPDDLLVIETGDIGWFCYFTVFLEVMTPLLHNRELLFQYLTGHPPASDTEEQQFLRSRALESCHIYLPGANIPNRFLMQETGRRGLEGARSSEYGQEMRFFRYDVDRPKRTQILDTIHGQLIGEAYGKRIQSRWNAFEHHSAYSTYEQMFTAVQSQGVDGLKVLFFPVCGEIQGSVPGQAVRVADETNIKLIVDLQKQADDAWTRLIGTSLSDVFKSIDHTYKGPKTVDSGAQFVGRAKFYTGPGELIPSRKVHLTSDRVTRAKAAASKGGKRTHKRSFMKSRTKKRLNKNRR